MRSCGLRIFCLEVLDLYWHDLISEFKSEYFRVEIKFRFENTLDVFRFAKAVLLAFKSEIGYGQLFCANGFDHLFGLIGRNDFVFESLKQNHRAIQPIGEVDRRAFDVKIAPFRIWADQAVEIA